MESDYNKSMDIPSVLRHQFYMTALMDEDTMQIKKGKLDNLYHLRHDLLHNLVNQVAGRLSTFGSLTKISDCFDIVLPESLRNYSPDLVFEQDGKVVILDISCTSNEEYYRNEKGLKYNPIIMYLRGLNLNVCDFYLFWVNPGWTNLNTAFDSLRYFLELEGFNSYPVNKDLLSDTLLMYEEISTRITKIISQLPIEMVRPTPHRIPPNYNQQTPGDLRRNALKIYQSAEKELIYIRESTIDQVEEEFTRLVEDPEVQSILEDTQHNNQMYDRAFTALEDMESNFRIHSERPSFFIPFASASPTLIGKLNSYPIGDFSLKKEQAGIMRFLGFINNCVEFKKDSVSSFTSFLETALVKCLNLKSELNIFNTGLLTDSFEQEMDLNRLFKKHKEDTNNKQKSKRSFFKETIPGCQLRDQPPFIYKNKCIKLPSMFKYQGDFITKSGTSYNKTHEVRDYKEKTTVPKDSYKHFENFMDLLEEQGTIKYETHKTMCMPPGVDSNECLKLKEIFLSEHHEFMEKIRQRNAHTFSKHIALSAAQLLHFNELRTTDNTFYMFSSGLPNILHIVQGGTLNRGNDVGQAYFTLFITDDKRWCNPVYGNLNVTSVKSGKDNFFICRTPWVRLSSERLTFMKDQYLSTLSTSFDSWSRNRGGSFTKDLFRFIYTFRVCVSASPSQRVAELLMDTRYIFMSALSTYSNVEQLILDKFQPPYKNSFEQFIVRQLHKKCKDVVLYLKQCPPVPETPGFSQSRRLHTTLGGEISLPSLWSNHLLTDIQSIFDDIFVYVHTSKEPSSVYHEQVKAINTILKYQEEFNLMTEDNKIGIFDMESKKRWILSGKHVGCCSKTIYQASLLFSETQKGLYNSPMFIESVLKEPLSNLVSTKACIPEYNRHTKDQEITENAKKKILKNIRAWGESSKSTYVIEPGNAITSIKKFVMEIPEENTEIVVGGSQRVKVHDAMLDWIERFGENAHYVSDLANWNIFMNNSRVLADTCIKAQYGSKREFYVINLGAKAMARVTENSYKVLSRFCKNEMISVPGDKKLVLIEEMLNEAIMSSADRNLLYYVNGDCTKWSSCETMASFIAMNEGLQDTFGQETVDYNLNTFCAWANKQIQVPQVILQNLRFSSEKTEYVSQEALINSSQNFLQGMFNASSSIKAVIATNFAIRMFRKNNPNNFLHCGHLEHSDDYSLVVRVRDQATFHKFRIYHKLSQKLFGINDSIKKTNIQVHIQEFISLFSFNGQLYYPNIKKTKETGTNLSCTDFRSDAMAIISRSAECVRIGVPLSSAYFMQRAHCASVADAYSLSPGMRNSLGTGGTLFSRPLEVFGLPDTLPIVTVCVKGNIDNFRLWEYGSQEVKMIMKGLYKLGQATVKSVDLPSIKEDEYLSEFYTPSFSYPQRNNKIKTIRDHLKMTYEQAVSYFDENLTDSMVKPVELERFKKWLRAMYFNNSFCKAYNRVSRSTMALRHSLFSSKPCIIPLQGDIYLTVKEYAKAIWKETTAKSIELTNKETKDFLNYIKCYSSSLELFYNMMSNSQIAYMYSCKPKTTVSKMPDPYIWSTFENNVSHVLQYLINPKNFYQDFRKFTSETSLYRDVEKLKRHYNLDLLKTSRQYCRTVFKEAMSQSKNRAFGVTFRPVEDLPSFIKQYIELGLRSGDVYKFIPSQNIQITNPLTNNLFNLRSWKTQLMGVVGELYELALIYRLITLRSATEESKYGNYFKLLNIKLSSGETLEEFLNLELEQINTFKVGERALKIFVFLKSRLIKKKDSLSEFLKSKFSYTYKYVRDKHFLHGFDEVIKGTFLNCKFTSYLCKDIGTPFIIMELQSFNRMHWFYCYTISQRHFGLISQIEFEERLMEHKDFDIPMLSEKRREALVRVPCTRETRYFNIMGNVFHNLDEPDKANVPIIHQYQPASPLYQELRSIDIASNVKVTDFSVIVGNVSVFKLPFGNLDYDKYLPRDTNNIGIFENIVLDGISIQHITENNLLLKYLKNEFDVFIPDAIVPELIEATISSGSKDSEVIHTETFDLEVSVADFDVRKFHNFEEPILSKPITLEPDVPQIQDFGFLLGEETKLTISTEPWFEGDSEAPAIPTSIDFMPMIPSPVVSDNDEETKEEEARRMEIVARNAERKRQRKLDRKKAKEDSIAAAAQESKQEDRVIEDAGTFNLSFTPDINISNFGSIQLSLDENSLQIPMQEEVILPNALITGGMPIIDLGNSATESCSPMRLNPELGLESPLLVEFPVNLPHISLGELGSVSTTQLPSQDDTQGSLNVIDEVRNLEIGFGDMNIAEAFKPIEEEIEDFDIFGVANTTSLLTSDLQDMLNRIETYTCPEINEVEEHRNLFTIEVDEDPIFDLDMFDAGDEFDNVLSSNSEDSSYGSNESTGIKWFQVAPPKATIMQHYYFEERCRNNMVPLSDYLLTCLTEETIQPIINNKKALGSLLRLFARVHGCRSRLKLKGIDSGVLSILKLGLKNALKKHSGIYQFDNSRGMEYSEGKIKFLATIYYEDEEQATIRASNNSRARLTRYMNNFGEGTWVLYPLLQVDLTASLNKNEDVIEFPKDNFISRVLNRFLPRLEQTKNELLGRYD